MNPFFILLILIVVHSSITCSCSLRSPNSVINYSCLTISVHSFYSTISVLLFLFYYLYSTISIQLFLFNYFCSTISLQLFVFNYLCSTICIHPIVCFVRYIRKFTILYLFHFANLLPVSRSAPNFTLTIMLFLPGSNIWIINQCIIYHKWTVTGLVWSQCLQVLLWRPTTEQIMPYKNAQKTPLRKPPSEKTSYKDCILSTAK